MLECRDHRLRMFAIGVCSLAVLSGCRPWPQQKEGPARFPTVRMKPDSIELEIALANHLASNASELEALWEALDEQAIPVETRRALDLNGLRCGIAPTRMPAVFQKLVARESHSASDASLLAHQLVQNGYGEIHPIEVGPSIAQLHWTMVDLEGRTRAGSCENAICLFDLRTYPVGDGTARIELIPKICHGQTRPKISSENSAFALRPLRDEISLPELAIRCRLKPGETLIVGPTRPEVGLGKSFFANEPSKSDRMRLVLIRLARTQWDDLFLPQRPKSPLATESL